MSVDSTLSCVFQQAATANGNGTPANVNGLACYSIDIQLNGDTGTINFEGEASDVVSGATPVWRTIKAFNVGAGTSATTATADGLFVVSCAGLSQIRARLSGHSGAGGVTVQGRGSYAHATLIS